MKHNHHCTPCHELLILLHHPNVHVNDFYITQQKGFHVFCHQWGTYDHAHIHLLFEEPPQNTQLPYLASSGGSESHLARSMYNIQRSCALWLLCDCLGWTPSNHKLKCVQDPESMTEKVLLLQFQWSTTKTIFFFPFL